MKINRIPNFLTSPDNVSDFFAFDDSGRFIICNQRSDRTFLIYDIIFNDYIKLKPDPPHFNIVIENEFETETFWRHEFFYLPINIEQMLVIIRNGETSVLLILVHLNLQKRTYKIVDFMTILKCHQPEFVRDGNIFGLFFKSSIDGEMGLVNNETSFFVLLFFTIQENFIKLGEKKRFNHKPYGQHTYPRDLYLRDNKLWYIRRVDQDINFLPNIMAYTPPPAPPQNPNLRICYFNLKENFPSEMFVDEIQIEEDKAHLLMQWVKDSLVFLQRGTKFNVLNLLNFEWSSEALDCGMDFTSLNVNGECQSDGIWVEFQFNKMPDAYWAYYSTIHIDNEFVLTAVNRETSTLHRIPLKEPLKLSFIAWCCVLNAGLIKENKNLPPNLPYTRLL